MLVFRGLHYTNFATKNGNTFERSLACKHDSRLGKRRTKRKGFLIFGLLPFLDSCQFLAALPFLAAAGKQSRLAFVCSWFMYSQVIWIAEEEDTLSSETSLVFPPYALHTPKNVHKVKKGPETKERIIHRMGKSFSTPKQQHRRFPL
ncbi:hypothetical protein POVWA2_015960 [Plasmodium ovale wallikeri]|uniref:Uncharacterized protein n=1 Tax=Plasmodium ovale wallikeri TaxID=864142 RepID=A0A1A8YQI4_PLAOA|nr:hypothetical protein POVWA2_015960 [Plasmodium ovale wallikeri]SBT38264.1 hypothetical protein POVWA1_037790 [Plasmodium ovale wallikeri]